jgi:hypothetical protein
MEEVGTLTPNRLHPFQYACCGLFCTGTLMSVAVIGKGGDNLHGIFFLGWWGLSRYDKHVMFVANSIDLLFYDAGYPALTQMMMYEYHLHRIFFPRSLMTLLSHVQEAYVTDDVPSFTGYS